MKAARLHGIGDLRLGDESPPIPAAGEIELRVQAVGICGSDLHWVAEGGIGDARLERPLVLGHECSALTASGERVAVDPAISCGVCPMCRSGNPNLCEHLIFAGHGTQDGALREIMTWPAGSLHPVPSSMTFAEAALLEPLGIALHAVELARLSAGRTVGVFGCGPIGLLILQLARRAGATLVVATDRLAHRLQAAKDLGVQQTLLAGEEDGEDTLQSLVDGRGVDVAFEAAGEQEAVDSAFSAAAAGGRVILVGIPANDQTAFRASVARRKGLTIKMVRRMKHTFPRLIQMVASGSIHLGSLVTHRLPLNRAVEGFAVAHRREGLKVIIEPAREEA